MKKLLMFLVCVAFTLPLVGCKKKTTEEKVQDAATELKQDADKTAKDAEKGAEDVKKEASKALDKLAK